MRLDHLLSKGFCFSGRGRDGRGMLSGSGAVRPGVRAPGPPSLGGLGVVGGLVVNCIVDASIDIVVVLRFVVVVVRPVCVDWFVDI